MTIILVNKLSDTAKVPTPMDVGYEIYSENNPTTIAPNTWATIYTDIALSIPLGYQVELRSRFSLARKYGVTVLNAPGSIGSDHVGEIQVILYNAGKEDYIVNPGDPIALAVVSRVEDVSLVDFREDF